MPAEDNAIALRALGNPSGSEYIKVLEGRYQRGPMFASTPEETLRRAAQFDVIEEIKNMVESGRNE